MDPETLNIAHSRGETLKPVEPDKGSGWPLVVMLCGVAFTLIGLGVALLAMQVTK